MPLTIENIENFYRGNSAENLVSSTAFFNGFEAHKFNPDFGVDLLVTNKARQKYLNEKNIEFNIQVKSALFADNKSYVSIDKDELSHLLRQENPVLIFCIFEGEIIGTPSLANNMDSIAQEIHSMDEWINNGWKKHRYNSQFSVSASNDKETYLKNKEAANNLNLDGFKHQLYWLNAKQIDRAIELGVLREGHKNNYYICFASSESGDWYFDSRQNESYYPFIEISYLSYLFLNNENYGIDMEEFAQVF